MKTLVLAAALGLAVFTAPTAEAAGCLRGAAVGGVAGHFVGHHGMLGAAAGCAIGHHRASRRQAQQDQMNGGGYQGDGQGTPSR